MEYKEIENLMKVMNESNLTELEIEKKVFFKDKRKRNCCNSNIEAP